MVGPLRYSLHFNGAHCTLKVYDLGVRLYSSNRIVKALTVVVSSIMMKFIVCS